ncbi:hypothetical protein AWB61_21310 [Chromobacterium sp. F49]|nr:hypothetical protein AWB61_21310 [Chromobacterium sp. F49]
MLLVIKANATRHRMEFYFLIVKKQLRQWGKKSITVAVMPTTLSSSKKSFLAYKTDMNQVQ